MIKTLKSITAIAFAAGTIISCGSDDSGESTPDISLVDETEVLDLYASIVSQNYQDALADAVSLETTINTFVADPTETNFEAARTAWFTARESYGTSEAFRFANGPIDDVDGPEGLINAWPLDEAYVDYVDGEGGEDSGIINDPVQFPTIEKATLEGLNEVGGPANISVGYHAIEFLLWGQDLTDPSDNLPGQRAYTDFVDGGTAENQDRRGEYLSVCADLLTDHLQTMVDEWAVGGPYRTEFTSLDEDEALANIITGIATLAGSELAGERIQVAFNNVDQEDEHSCFSDNTDRDIRLNLEGVANVYRGSYSTISGASLEDLILQADPVLGAEITAQLILTEAAVEATGEPFDLAIFDEDQRPAIRIAVNELMTLGDLFVEGAAALGLSINAG